MHPTGEAAVQSGGGAVENLCLLHPGSYSGTTPSHTLPALLPIGEMFFKTEYCTLGLGVGWFLLVVCCLPSAALKASHSLHCSHLVIVKKESSLQIWGWEKSECYK